MIISIRAYDHHSLDDIEAGDSEQDSSCILHVVGRFLKADEIFLRLSSFETISIIDEVASSKYDINSILISTIIGTPICYKHTGETGECMG